MKHIFATACLNQSHVSTFIFTNPDMDSIRDFMEDMGVEPEEVVLRKLFELSHPLRSPALYWVYCITDAGLAHIRDIGGNFTEIEINFEDINE